MGDRTTWPARFWAKVDVQDCWWWLAGRTGNGYGSCRDGASRVQFAHRVAWTLLVGEIPPGLVVDHLCRNRLCVNPDHLELVTNRTNILRGEGRTAHNARKSACSCGRPYVRAAIGRKCPACARERARLWHIAQTSKGD